MGGIIVPILASKCRLRGAVLIGPVLPKPTMADIFNTRIEIVKKGQLILSITRQNSLLKMTCDRWNGANGQNYSFRCYGLKSNLNSQGVYQDSLTISETRWLQRVVPGHCKGGASCVFQPQVSSAGLGWRGRQNKSCA